MRAAGVGNRAVIIVNDIDNEIASKMLKYFGLYETYRKDIVTEEDAGIMRKNQRRMYEWARCCTTFRNLLMHMGKGTVKFKYDIGDWGVTFRV